MIKPCKVCGSLRRCATSRNCEPCEAGRKARKALEARAIMLNSYYAYTYPQEFDAQGWKQCRPPSVGE